MTVSAEFSGKLPASPPLRRDGSDNVMGLRHGHQHTLNREALFIKILVGQEFGEFASTRKRRPSRTNIGREGEKVKSKRIWHAKEIRFR